MLGDAKHSQTLPLHRTLETISLHRPQMLPSISDKTTNTVQEEHEHNLALRKRINELEGNMRMLDKQYRSNLKQGFENKIKSFRLQAVLQRKVFKDTLENAKREVEEQELQHKMRRAQHIKISQIERANSISARLQEKRQRVRSKAERERSLVEEKIKQLQEQAAIDNREVHDRIQYEARNNDRKKKYLQKLQRQKFERQENLMKQQFLEKIVTNEETLGRLKQQLSLMLQHSKTVGPFITI